MNEWKNANNVSVSPVELEIFIFADIFNVVASRIVDYILLVGGANDVIVPQHNG